MSESPHKLTRVEMKKQNLSKELKSSQHKVEKPRVKADDSVRRGQGRLSRTLRLHRSGRFPQRNRPRSSSWSRKK